MAGVTAIETSAAAVTVSVVEPETEFEVAVIVVEPWVTAVASPLLLMVAVPVFEELHCAVDVMFCVEPSL